MRHADITVNKDGYVIDLAVNDGNIVDLAVNDGQYVYKIGHDGEINQNLIPTFRKNEHCGGIQMAFFSERIGKSYHTEKNS